MDAFERLVEHNLECRKAVYGARHAEHEAHLVCTEDIDNLHYAMRDNGIDYVLWASPECDRVIRTFPATAPEIFEPMGAMRTEIGKTALVWEASRKALRVAESEQAASAATIAKFIHDHQGTLTITSPADDHVRLSRNG